MRLILFSFALLLVSHFASATTGSIFDDYQSLQIKQIADGLILKSLTYDQLFGSKQVIHVLEVDLNQRQIKPIQFNGCKLVSQIAPTQSALAAVNGTFFKSNCGSTNLLKINGRLYSKNAIRKSGSIALLVDALGIPAMKMTKKKENPKSALHAMGGFPQLIARGEIDMQPRENTSFYLNRYARTAVGIISTSQMVVITVDGGTPERSGFTLLELANFMRAYGVTAAMNLDGGTSTVMWTHQDGVVNRPSSTLGEKPVADALGIF